MRSPRGNTEPIEDYLDELFSCLRLPPRAARRLLAETEDHLRESAAELSRRGATSAAAEREAVRRFGPPARIAADARAARRPTVADTIPALAWAAATLAGVGLVAVGASGILAALFNALPGRRFVGALPISYSAATCRHFLALHPGSKSCAAAAILENSDDAVALRLLAGLVGLVFLVTAWWTRRYLTNDVSFRRLLDVAVAATACLAFAFAAVLLVGMTLDDAVQSGGRGAGWYLSGGLASAAGFVVAAAFCWRNRRLITVWRGTGLDEIG